jgi:tellurite resistance protein TerC
VTVDAFNRRVRALLDSLPRPLRRALLLVIGSAVLLVGAALLVLPGPGLLVLGLGVALLALEFEWARRIAGGVMRLARGLSNRLGVSR